MMIFDEASADLDPKAEHMFYRCIKEYAKDKLTFYITHRLSGTKDADLILVMNNGQLVESGTHKELIEADGSASDRAYEAALQQADVIVIDVDIGKDIGKDST